LKAQRLKTFEREERVPVDEKMGKGQAGKERGVVTSNPKDVEGNDCKKRKQTNAFWVGRRRTNDQTKFPSI